MVTFLMIDMRDTPYGGLVAELLGVKAVGL